MTETTKAPVALVALALAAVYLIWGSTFLAILFAIDTIPPFTMAGVRFTVAGALLYGFLRLRGHPAPPRTHWLTAAITGALLLAAGNGGVTWAEQRIASGAAALICATIPVWMILLDWARRGGRRPGLPVLAGAAVGLAGVGLLVFAGGDLRSTRVDPVGALVVLAAALAWAFGSIVARSMPVPSSSLQLTAMQMLAGGALLLVAGALSGDWRAFEPSAVSGGSLLALAHLIVLGSWVGYGAYVWLLRATTPALASTYAYVNPGVAVLLGWLLAGEPMDAWTLAAMALTVAGVAMITLGPALGRRRAAAPEGLGARPAPATARAPARRWLRWAVASPVRRSP